MRCSTRFIVLLFLAGLGAATAAFVASASPRPERVNGAYRLTFAGALKGRGTAVVGGNRITINGTVTDTDGRSGQLHVECDLVRRKFYGVGTVLGSEVQVEGRVDPQAGSRRSARAAHIMATVATPTHYARIAGERSAEGSSGED